MRRHAQQGIQSKSKAKLICSCDGTRKQDLGKLSKYRQLKTKHPQDLKKKIKNHFL